MVVFGICIWVDIKPNINHMPNKPNLPIVKLTNFERLQRIHDLISHQSTGNTVVFAKQLGISRSQLFLSLKELRNNGAPICYSRIKKTYYYQFPTSFCLCFKPRITDEPNRENEIWRMEKEKFNWIVQSSAIGLNNVSFEITINGDNLYRKGNEFCGE